MNKIDAIITTLRNTADYLSQLDVTPNEITAYNKHIQEIYSMTTALNDKTTMLHATVLSNRTSRIFRNITGQFVVEYDTFRDTLCLTLYPKEQSMLPPLTDSLIHLGFAVADRHAILKYKDKYTSFDEVIECLHYIFPNIELKMLAR